MTAKVLVCKDCLTEGISTNRPAIHPGPRCVTHYRAWKRRSGQVSHARHIQNVYGITEEQYNALYEAQGGRCFVCGVATGASKRLAVEHEHGLCDDHSPERGCKRCIRGLCCGRCNRLVAFLGVEALTRAIQLIVDPPARKILS